jgi:hypothetical protein
MRLTIPAIAISAATFAATFAFAPAVADAINQFTLESPAVEASTPAAPARPCTTPVARIVDALSSKICP